MSCPPKSQRFRRTGSGKSSSSTVACPSYVSSLVDGLGLSNVKILITLSYGEGCVRSQEFVAEDLGEEDIVGQQLAP
jgi:hypothetical protein